MNLDPTLSLAFALNGTPGAYALLLGSGVSRAAGIPTGWEIVLDLVKRAAEVDGQDASADPVGWYRKQFGEDPRYDKLLGMIAKTPAERRQVLRGYFEPNDEERERGEKQPTSAHRAVARLVTSSHVRVIVTTNFDRLVEEALGEVGITPTVISSPDAVAGALPLTHERITVVKLHGDYQDVRLRNTPEELEAYDPAFDKLLDRVFDEYGLIVCGWSAEWDVALRSALRRCSTHRFMTAWLHVGMLGNAAADLVQLRRAQAIAIESADVFFQTLAEKVTSLADIARPHPALTQVAVATLKRYLPSAEQRIRLHDCVMEEVETVSRRIVADRERLTSQGDYSQLAKVMSEYEAMSETVMAMLATGAYWGGADQRQLWVLAIERLGQVTDGPWRTDPWAKLLRYPAQLALYAAGIGALARHQEETLADILLLPQIRSYRGSDAAVEALHLWSLIDTDTAKRLPGLERRTTPLSDHLAPVLRQPLLTLVRDDVEFGELFDMFEYLVALARPGWEDRNGDSRRTWGPIGRYCYRNSGLALQNLAADIKARVEKDGANWFLLKRGLFAGSTERLLAAKGELDGYARRLLY